MAVTFTSTAPGTSADYARYLYTKPVKTDQLNDSDFLDFSLVPIDGNFVKLKRGNYITISTATYGNWFTGFITNDPELEPIGKDPKTGQYVWGFKYKATSDEYLLNQQSLGILPPFQNMTQGAILTYLVNQLAPGVFDVSNIQSGVTLSRYVVDPTKKFGDIAKEFCDSACYRFYANSKKLYFRRMDADPAPLTIDGSNKHFSPYNLTISPNTDPIINDAIVLGDIEPQTYINEYFIGDGFTAKFPLMSNVFGVDGAVLLDDDFSGNQIDTAKWTPYDTANTWLQMSNGFLNVLGGNANNTLDVHLDSANVMALAGNLSATHGDYDFVNNASAGMNGVVASFWSAAPSMTDNQTFPNCVYGIRVQKNQNLIPDSDFLAALGTNWTSPTGSVIVTNGGAVRGNSFAITGTGAASGFVFTRSATMTVVPLQTYTVSCYIDARNCSVASPFIGVYDPTITTNYISKTQAVGTNGRVSASFTVPSGVTQVKVILDSNNATITNGQKLIFSNPQLELGSAATVYESTANSATSDTNTYLVPVVNGVLDRTQSLAIDFSKRYILRTVFNFQNVYRMNQKYSYLDANGVVQTYGGVTQTDTLVATTYLTQINPSDGTISNGFPVVWSNTLNIASGTVFANYIPVASNDLHCTVTNITVSLPMLAALEVKASGVGAFVSKIVGPNEVDSMDGLSPIATITQTGTSQKNSTLGTQAYNAGNPELVFFKNSANLTSTIPGTGDILHLRYRRAGAAVGRVRNLQSVQLEASAWGDTGVRSISKKDLNPVPRTAIECEAAAAAIVGQQGFTHYTGGYTVYSDYVTSEPQAGLKLPFSNLPASTFGVTSFTETIYQVVTTFDSTRPQERFIHEIKFGRSSDDENLKNVLSGFQKPSDVFTPQWTAEVPYYVQPSSVGLAFAPDITGATLDMSGTHAKGVDSNNIYYTLNNPVPNVPNLLLQTSNMLDPHWVVDVAQGSTVVSGITDFNGTTGAYRFTKGPNTAGNFANFYQLLQGVDASNKSYTFSIWLQAVSGTQVVALSISDYTTTTKTATVTATTTWQRFSVTLSGVLNTGFLGAGFTLFTAAGTQVNFCLPQLEVGTQVTDYIANGGTYSTTGGYEVRYTDEQWGCDTGKNLITRVNSGSTFSVPRTNRGKLCFVRQYDFRNKIAYSEDGTRWTAYPNVSSITMVNMANPDGDIIPVAKAVYTAAGTGVGIPHNGSFQCSLTTVTGSVWVKGPAGQTATLVLDSSNGVTPSSQTITLNGTWQYMQATGTFPGNSTGSGLLLVRLNGAGTMYITKASTELGTSPTTYCKTTGNYYGALSRYAAGLRTAFPLVPPAPTGSVDFTDPVNPKVTLTLPTVMSDVWGVELRRAQNWFTNTTTYAGWANQSTTITPGQIDPLGGTTAALLTNNGAVPTDPFINQIFTNVGSLAGRTFTFQAQVKGAGTAVGKNGTLYLYDGTVTYVFTKPVVITAAWQTITLTCTFPAAATSTQLQARVDFVDTGAVTGDQAYVYGCQLEENTFATPYYATNGTPACFGRPALMYHSDLTNASYVNVVTDALNNQRSLGYYLYTYNLLGEYSPAALLTATIPTPTATALAVNQSSRKLSWTGSTAAKFYNIASTVTLPVGGTTTINKQTTATEVVLSDPEFFLSTTYVVTPFDALGAGTPSTGLTFQYTPTALTEFNGNEVFVVTPPASPTANPVVPANIGEFGPDYIENSWSLFSRNRLVRN